MEAHVFSVSKRNRQTKSANKDMVNIFFDDKGVICKLLVPRKSTWMRNIFFGLENFTRTQIEKLHELVANLTIHHNNVHPHVATSVHLHLSKCNIKIMPYPLNSPNLTSYDFRLFFTLKKKQRGRIFNTDTEVILDV